MRPRNFAAERLRMYLNLTESGRSQLPELEAALDAAALDVDRERLRVALDRVQEAENREGLHIPLYLHLDAILAELRGER